MSHMLYAPAIVSLFWAVWVAAFGYGRIMTVAALVTLALATVLQVRVARREYLRRHDR